MQHDEFATKTELDLLRQELERFRSEMDLKMENHQLNFKQHEREHKFGNIDKSLVMLFGIIVLFWMVVMTVFHFVPH